MKRSKKTVAILSLSTMALASTSLAATIGIAHAQDGTEGTGSRVLAEQDPQQVTKKDVLDNCPIPGLDNLTDLANLSDNFQQWVTCLIDETEWSVCVEDADVITNELLPTDNSRVIIIGESRVISNQCSNTSELTVDDFGNIFQIGGGVGMPNPFS